MEEVWVRQVIASFQTIWNWHHGVADVDAPWSYPVARSAFLGRLRASLSSAASGLPTGLSVARDLRHLFAACRHFISAPHMLQQGGALS
jgi:hypothetical protein